MSNNFLQWNPPAANQENDAAYLADALRAGGAPANAIFPSALANKVFFQASTMNAALGQMLSDKGFAVSDANLNNLKTVLANLLTAGDLSTLRVSRNLFADFHEIVHSNTLAETSIYTATIPGNTLSVFSRLEISTFLILQAQGGVSSTLRLRLGSAVVFTIGMPSSGAGTPTNGPVWLKFSITPRNGGITLQCIYAQDVYGVFGNNFPAHQFNTSGVDLTVTQDLSITVQNGVLSDNQRWQNMTVDLV